jgi:flagellar biosynthetic protein FliR
MLVIGMVLPYLGGPIQNLFNQGIETTRSLPRAGAARSVPPPIAPAPAIR